MAAIEVYWASGSQHSWRVLLVLELKRIAYQSRLIDFGKREHLTSEFLALNPRHKVPVITDEVVVLNESVAIMAYLDAKFPEPSLFGKSPARVGYVWRAIAEFQHYLEPILLDRVVRPIFFGMADEQRESIEQATPTLHAELGRLEAALSKQPWLLGEELSAVDVVIFPQVMGLLRAATRPAARELQLNLLPFDARYPAIQRWLGRIEQLPGYEKTYPPHWRTAA